jgi:chromosome segregation ATPase|tara:strand:+ start:710 stop:1048 length:339 start_codon:yes stop_codon:yes gene_type:complete
MKNDWIGELTELAQKHQVNLLLLQFNNSKNDLDVVASGHNPIANELIDKLSTDKEMSSAPIKLIVESLQVQNRRITELKKTNKSLIKDIEHMSNMYAQLWKKLEDLKRYEKN